MSTLTLVRPGQAQPFQQDADRLSEMGEAQARALAASWIRQGVEVDEVWSGSMHRHRRTEELVA